MLPRPAAPQRPAALLDLLLLARRQLALDQDVPASPEDSATAVAAVLVTLSFASHQLSNHTLEKPLRFPLGDNVARDFRSFIALVRVDLVNFDVRRFILVNHIDFVS